MSYIIGGVRVPRRHLIKLTPNERKELGTAGKAIVRRRVEWPVPARTPYFDRAYVDEGGTDIWGPGPYLKVPNRGTGEGYVLVNRVFCPWGYPPDTVRVGRRKVYLRLERVEIAEIGAGEWEWVLTVVQSSPPRPCP